MRVIVTSDTHYHPRYQRVLTNCVAEMALRKPDCIVLAGDVGERIDGYCQMLRLLQNLDCPRLILTGNHDLWSRDGATSDSLWDEVLPRLTREYGAIWLEGENWCSNGLGICGTNGWYDYSAADPSISMSAEQYLRDKDRYMADGTYVDWLWSDVEFSERIGAAFSARLMALEADPAIREILIVTHVPAFEEGIARKPGDVRWNISNAYFGNLTLGKRILTSRKVTRVISGHTHVGRVAQIQGAAGPNHLIEMEVLAADYGAPYYVVIDFPGSRDAETG